MRKIVKVSVKSTLVAILLTVFLVVLVSATKGIATHNYHASFTQMVSDSNLRDSSLIEHGIKVTLKMMTGLLFAMRKEIYIMSTKRLRNIYITLIRERI